MWKACSRCGKIHSSGYKCNVGRVYNVGVERELRNTYKWAQKSVVIREASNYLCAVCRDKGIYNYNNIEVHHIEKLKDHPDKLLEDENLICLCAEHHRQADRGEIATDYLKKLVRDREE